MNHQEIREYVIHTIKTGNKERIKKVLARYQKWLNKNDEEESNIVKIAKEIFDV